MLIKHISPCIVTDRINESRDFYKHYFGAKVTFDCGWYINLDFQNGYSLQFMSPDPEKTASFNTSGLTYNFCVHDVDAIFSDLIAAGLRPTMPLEDHPWGDRGFAIEDPNGITVYIYSEREPSAEFKAYYL